MDKKNVELKYPDYEPIDTVMDPSKAHPDCEFSEKNSLVKKVKDGYSWSHVQGKYGLKKRSAHNSKYLLQCKLVKSRLDVMIGVAHKMADYNERSTYSSNKDSYLYYGNNGNLWYQGTSKGYASAFKEGDEIGILLDMHKGEIRFLVNGEDKGVAHTDNALTTGEFFFTIQFYEVD
jgi:hypothetical protein